MAVPMAAGTAAGVPCAPVPVAMSWTRTRGPVLVRAWASVPRPRCPILPGRPGHDLRSAWGRRAGLGWGILVRGSVATQEPPIPLAPSVPLGCDKPLCVTEQVYDRVRMCVQCGVWLCAQCIVCVTLCLCVCLSVGMCAAPAWLWAVGGIMGPGTEGPCRVPHRRGRLC